MGYNYDYNELLVLWLFLEMAALIVEFLIRSA